MKKLQTMRYASDDVSLNVLETPNTSEIQVLRTGTFNHPVYGKFSITDDTLASMLKNFDSIRPKAPTELVVDYDHLSVGNDTPEAGRAAGWFKSLRIDGSKLFAMIEWTEEAAQTIVDKLYRFVSPEFDLNFLDRESNKRIGPTLISAALTNRPFLQGMEPVVLCEALEAMMFSEVARDEPAEDADNQGDTQNDSIAAPEAGVGDSSDTDNQTGKELKEDIALDESKIRKLLVIGEEDSIEDAVAALVQAKDTAVVTDLETKLAAETVRADGAELKLSESKVETTVNQAITDGKITPKLKDWAALYAMKDPEGFAAYVAAADKVGPPEGELGGGDNPDANIALTETEKKIALKMGVSEELMLKAKTEEAAQAATK